MQKVLPFELSGNKKSNTLVIFLHGFPDNIRIWDNLIKEIALEDAQFLTITYPNYHKQENLFFGQDIATIVDRIKNTVDYVEQGKGLKKIFVTHDWGAQFGYILDSKYPKYMDDMIALDIGGVIGGLKPLYSIFFILYQIIFASAFLIGLIPLIGIKIGTTISRQLLKLMGMSDKSIPDQYNCTMNYLYVYVWINFLYSLLKRDPKIRFLHNYEPSVPIVYMYGTKKPFMYHSPKWQLVLAKNKDSEYIGTDGGHWIMRHSLSKVVEKIQERIKRLKVKQ